MEDAEGKINGHRASAILRQLRPDLDPSMTPDPEDLAFDLDAVASGVTALRAQVPSDAHTAPYLGTEREGNAVAIHQDGLVVTIGYLILESQSVQVATAAGDWIESEVVGYDFETGFGLVRPRRPLDILPIGIGNSDDLREGEPVVIAARGGRDQALTGTVASRREFAGYWEYLLDDAIFTAPAHPNWSGSALIGADGRLRGIGSLLVEDAGAGGEALQGNMFVPIDLLTPLIDRLSTVGRARDHARPWLGMFTADTATGLVVVHISPDGPADRAGIIVDDSVVRVAGEPVSDLADMYRRMWGLGDAGVAVPLTVIRDTAGIELTVHSASRYDYFKTPRE
ncbi:MAG: S1C family serine protease [Alphaproteobacteria bacterium]|nr:S1C family serine protease [Alphaproteobacteria bacterium]MDP6516730.1 S1C family serine protease [Alphaproteobacteria bacterium]